MSRRGDAVFLVGFMGSGKTTVGRALAARLGRRFVDTDERVCEREGTTIERLFAERGEGAFRRAESEALVSLDPTDGLVVATGGGLWGGVAERRFVRRRGTSVWLDAPLELCRRRLGPGEGRPLWAQADPLSLRALYEKRRAAYALADLRLTVRDEPLERVVERLVDRLAEGGRGPFR